MEGTKEIRPLGPDELEAALALAWDVFTAQLAAEYTGEGVDEFWSAIDHEYALHRMGDGVLRFWGAFDGGRLIGLCALRELSHLELLFVAPDHQGRGAGTALLKKALLDGRALDAGLDRLTVQAPEPARGFFETLGFRPLGPATLEYGMLHTPMALEGRPA